MVFGRGDTVFIVNSKLVLTIPLSTELKFSTFDLVRQKKIYIFLFNHKLRTISNCYE